VIDGDRSAAFLSNGGRFLAAAGEEAWKATLDLDDIDINGDGNLDLAATIIRLGNSSVEAERSAVAGKAPATARTSSRAVQVVDLDRDGDIDVVIPSTVVMQGTGEYLVLLNDGSGRFSAADEGTVLPAGSDGNGFDTEVADFDDDGIADLFLCNRASISEPDSAAASGGRQRLLLGERIRE
jgi:hypothetical protein